MLLQILLHVPAWVYAIFVLLAAYGAWQLRERTLTLARVLGVAGGMVGLGAFGVLAGFGTAAGSLAAAVASALAAVAVVTRLPLPEGTRFDAASGRFTVPGSVVPLLLMMGIFLTKFAVGVALALHSQLRSDATFALVIPAVYGAFSGTFLARALRLAALARRERAPLAAQLG